MNPDPRLHDRLVQTCSRARGVIAGSRFIADWCLHHNPETTVIWTGTPVTPGRRPEHRQRPPVIAWAQSTPLKYPAELAFVRDFCWRMSGAAVEFKLRLYGVDTEEERQRLAMQFGFLRDRLETFPFMNYQRFVRSLYDVSIGLSPIIPESRFSRGKSFGKILAYLDAKVPSIVSDEADHALFFTHESGIVSNDIQDWISGAQKLLAFPDMRDRMADAAFERFREQLSTDATATQVACFLERL